MTRHLLGVLGATATAVALAACTTAAPATSRPTGPAGSDARGAGLALDVPEGFVLDARDEHEVTWLGPVGDDGTRVGITATRSCDGPPPDWQDVLDVVARGDHTGWRDFIPTTEPVGVEVAGATAAVRSRGTFTLETASTEERAELVHDEVLLRDPAGVVHRVHVEGAADAVGTLDLDALFGSVAVAEPGCPA